MTTSRHESTSHAHRASHARHTAHAALVETTQVTHAAHVGDTAPKALSEKDQALLAAQPLHTPAEIHSYLRPAAGIDRVASTVVQFLRDNDSVA